MSAIKQAISGWVGASASELTVREWVRERRKLARVTSSATVPGVVAQVSGVVPELERIDVGSALVLGESMRSQREHSKALLVDCSASVRESARQHRIALMFAPNSNRIVRPMAVASGGDFDKPLWESEYEYRCRWESMEHDNVSDWIMAVASRAGRKAVGAIVNGRNKRKATTIALDKGESKVVSWTSEQEAIASARYAVLEYFAEKSLAWGKDYEQVLSRHNPITSLHGTRIIRVGDKGSYVWSGKGKVWKGSVRRAQGELGPLLPGDKLRSARRSWLFVQAWRAAFKSLTELPNGMRGRRSVGVRQFECATMSMDCAEVSRQADESSGLGGTAGMDLETALEQAGFVESELLRQKGAYVQGGTPDCFETIDGIVVRKRSVASGYSERVEMRSKEYSRASASDLNALSATDYERKVAQLMVWRRIMARCPQYTLWLLNGDKSANTLRAVKSARNKAKLVCLVLNGVPLVEAATKAKLPSFGNKRYFVELLSASGIDVRGLASCFA